MDRWIQVLATMSFVLLTFYLEVHAADVPYLSGGVGADAREELLAKEKEYNLKIIAAERSGDYLAGVKVVIESASKEKVLDTTMEGPILLAIRAISDGQTLTRTVTVPVRGLRQVDVRWNMTK